MIFVLDQIVPDPIARVTQQAGHEVHRLRETLPVDSPDAAVLAFAHSRGLRNAAPFFACYNWRVKPVCKTTLTLPDLV